MGEIMEELDLFFEYEKHDTVEEFQLNFTSFILQTDHKNEAINYLIKLFNTEKEQLNLDKRQETDENHLIQLRSQIRKTKNIITYLRSQYVKEVKEKQKTNKKKKNFSQEVVELVSILKEEDNISNFIKDRQIKLDDINEILSYLKFYSQQLIRQKIQLRNNKQYDSLAEIQININKYKQVIKELIGYKEKIKEDKKNTVSYHFPIDVQNELKQHLQHLLNAEDKVATLSSIINIYYSHLELERQKYQNLLGKREEIVSRLSQNYTKEQIEQQISLELKETETNMKYLIGKYHYYCNLSQKEQKNKKRKANVEFADEITIDDTQELIKRLILEGKEPFGYENNDILYALAHCIKHSVISNEILSYSRKITNEIMYENEDEKAINGIYYIQDALKFRLSNTPKEEIEIRKILKEIQTLFDSVIRSYKQNKNIKQNDYLFNLVDYFLETEDYFQYLKRIVEKMPKIVNARYRNEKTNTNEHIMIYIVDKYIKNYQKMLENKDSDYINPDYLKSIYFLFAKCYKLHLTKEDKNTINNMLANFMRMVNKSITSSNRKYAVKMDLKEIYTDKFYFDQKWYIKKEIDDKKLDNEITNTFNSLSENITSRKNQIDCTDEHTVILTNGYHAYSLSKKDGQTILKIHVVDLYNAILLNSELGKYIFNQSLMNLPIDNMIIHNFSMAEGGIYPTITFEIIFNHKENYKIENNFQIYKSKVKIAKNYSKYDMNFSKGDPVLETYKDLYRKLDSKNNENHTTSNLLSNLEDCFEKTLNKLVIKYFQEKNLPFIYSGICSKSEKDFIELRNNISYLLNRLEKNDFDKIYRVLNENVDTFHYSTEYFEGEYQFSLMNPLSYPGLLIQNVLHELVIDNKHNQKEYGRAVKKYSQEFEKAISYLNYYNNYIDSEALKANKGKLVKVKKILF